MANTYKIRKHFGIMQTKHGVDTATVFDDPVNPKYTKDEVIEELMSILGYKESDDENFAYPGTYEDIGAYFDYNGYDDIEIPESIINRIINDHTN